MKLDAEIYLISSQKKSKNGAISYQIIYPKNISNLLPSGLYKRNQKCKRSVKEIEQKLRFASHRRRCFLNQRISNIKKRIDKVNQAISLKANTNEKIEKELANVINEILENNCKVMQHQMKQAQIIVSDCEQKIKENFEIINTTREKLNRNFKIFSNITYDKILEDFKEQMVKKQFEIFSAEMQKEKLFQNSLKNNFNSEIIKNITVSKNGNISYELIDENDTNNVIPLPVMRNAIKTTKININCVKQKLQMAENRRNIAINLKMENISKHLKNIESKKKERKESYNASIPLHESFEKRNNLMEKLKNDIKNHNEKIEMLQKAIDQQNFIKQNAIVKKQNQVKSMCDQNISELLKLLECTQLKSISEFKNQILLLEKQNQAQVKNKYKIDNRLIPLSQRNKTAKVVNRSNCNDVIQKIQKVHTTTCQENVKVRNSSSGEITNHPKIHEYNVKIFEEMKTLLQQNIAFEKKELKTSDLFSDKKNQSVNATTSLKNNK